MWTQPTDPDEIKPPETPLWPQVKIGTLFVLFLVCVAATVGASIPRDEHVELYLAICYGGLLFSAPVYLIGGGLITIWATAHADDEHSQIAFLVFRIVGELWVLGKIIYYLVQHRRDLKLEQRRYEGMVASKAERKREFVKVQQLLDDTLQAFEEINCDILSLIRHLKATCEEAFWETTRGMAAMHSTPDISFYDAVFADVTTMCIRLQRATGGSQPGLEFLLASVVKILDQETSEHAMEIARTALLKVEVNSELGTPALMVGLKIYDAASGQALTSIGAEAYLSFISSAASLCEQRVSVQMVLEGYRKVLTPYLATPSSDRRNQPNTLVCLECETGYQFLDLPYASSIEKVKSTRRALAEVLHPDKLSQNSDRARAAGEQQLKKINAACDHILQCRVVVNK